MTLEELNEIARAEELDPKNVRLVLRGGYELNTIDGDESMSLGYPPSTMLFDISPARVEA